jgi:hypothetical protein
MAGLGLYPFPLMLVYVPFVGYVEFEELWFGLR